MISVVGAPGVKIAGDALAGQLGGILVRNRPPRDNEHVLGPVLLEALEDARGRESCVLPRGSRCRRRRHPPGSPSRRFARASGVGRVDDLHPGVAKRPCDDLSLPGRAHQVRLGDDDTCCFCSHNPESREDPAQVERPVNGEIVSMKLTCRVLARVAESWRRPVGLLARGPGRLLLDCGPGVLARLRSNGRTAGPKWTRSRSPISTSTTGETSSPWVWGTMRGLGRDYGEARALASAWRPRKISPGSASASARPTCSRASSSRREYEEGQPFEAAGLELTALQLPHYTVQTYGFPVSNSDRTLAYSGDSAPSERLAHAGQRTSTSSSARPRSSAGQVDGEPRGR